MAAQRRTGTMIAVAVAIVLTMLCGIGFIAASTQAESVKAPTIPTAQAGAKASPVPTSEVDPGWTAGVYRVVTDIPVGSYKTKGAGVKGDVLGGCYWGRLKDESGEFGSIIANGTLDSASPGKMVVRATDKFVEFKGDCAWFKA